MFDCEKQIAKLKKTLSDIGSGNLPDILKIIGNIESSAESANQLIRDQDILLDSISLQIWFVTEPDTYGRVNKAHAAFKGLSKEDLQFKKVSSFLSSPIGGTCSEDNRKVFESCKCATNEKWVDNAEGESRLLHITRIPKLNMKGVVEYIICTAEDITEKRSNEIKMKEEHTFIETLINASPSFIVSIDADSNIIMMNDSLLLAVGYTQEEVKGVNYIDTFIPEENRGNVRRVFDYLIQKGEPTFNENKMLTRDGKILTVEWHGRPILKENGDFDYFFGTGRNITKEKMALKALKESEERYRKLFDSSKDAIMTLAPPLWKFSSGNPAILDMFGIANIEELLLLEPWMLSPEIQPDGQLSEEKAKEMIKIAMDEGSNFFEWMHKKKDGDAFPATVLLTKVSLSNNVFLQATVRDITKQKETVAEKEHLIDELRSTIEKVRTLTGLIPICANCKKIRDDSGFWDNVDVYIQKHTNADFSHSICPECMKKLYPEFPQSRSD